MLFELFVFGGILFWIITAIFAIIIFSILENVDDVSAATIALIVYLGIMFGLSNIEYNFVWWHLVTYFSVGFLWFMFRMTANTKKLRKWIDSQPDPDKIRKSFKEDDGYDSSIPREYRTVYQTEPSWPKFFDRVVLWPLSFAKYLLADLLFDIYDSLSKLLISYRNTILGIK